MSRFLSLVFFILIFQTGYTQSENNQLDDKGQKQGFWQKRLPNGNLQYEGYFKNDQPIGEFKRYHTNGLLKAKLIYKESNDTIAAELFDMRGRPMALGHYIGQEKDGHWQYFKDGQLISEEDYEHGIKNGLSKTYYPSGELFEESHWTNNQKAGIYKAYFKTGKPYMECQMTEGKRDGTCQVYFDNGAMELDGFYKQGLRDGEWKYYQSNGDFAYSLHYDLGMLLNPEVRDSVQQIQLNQMEKNKSNIVDPEKFMNDPMQYMMKNNMMRR